MKLAMKLVAKSLFLLVSFGAILAHAQTFQHVVIIFQENRTPDNLFQGLCGPTRQFCPVPYNLRNYGFDKGGRKIPLVRTPLGINYDPDHELSSFLTMCDLNPATNTCRMDGQPTTGCPFGACEYAYVNPGDVEPYLAMAQQYGWANYMFSTQQGPTLPGHQFIFSGTSATSAEYDAAATFVSNNPNNGTGTGCLATLDEINWVVSPQSWPTENQWYNDPLGTFCIQHDSMATLLDNHQPPLSWKYYANGASPIGTAPNWFQDICVPDSQYQNCTGQEWLNNVDVYPPDFFNDIGACKLANMTWIIPRGQDSDHPGDPSFTGGPSWVASIVNAIGESTCKNPDGSSFWNSTAIFITWDDWGGWYDHEAPTLLSVPSQGQGDYQYGFRVPLVVVSAYTPRGYVDNARHDFGSILRFVEQNYGIPEGALGFADARSTTDLVNFFNRINPPRRFQHINSPLGADFFLHDKTPMAPLDSD